MDKKGTNPTRLTSQQKTGFVLLLVFGILAVGLGFLQLHNVIYGPFVFKYAKRAAPSSYLDETALLQKRDTDKDGLNDFEEIEFYQTSIYLPDTDSDGISDKDEVEQNTDPLCPEGKDCGEESTPPKNKNERITPDLGSGDIAQGMLGAAAGSLGQTKGLPASGAGIGEIVDFKELLNNPAKLREAIISTGRITEEQLSKVSDNDLVKMLEEFQEQQLKAQKLN